MNAGIPEYLLRLKLEGSLALSAFSVRARNELKTLLDSGVLVIERTGRGESVAVREPERLTVWLNRTFPASGENLDHLNVTPRARAAAQHRNTKRGEITHLRRVLQVRCLDSHGIAWLEGKQLPVGMLTTSFGLAAVVIDSSTTITLPSPCALVENQEIFFHCERLLPDVKSVLYSGGRISNLLIEVLARSMSPQMDWWHFPDYDPIGLEDFSRLHRQSQYPPKLFVPDKMEQLLDRYGQRLILEKGRNRDVFNRLGASPMPTTAAQAVFDLIRRTGKVLEQEALIAAQMQMAQKKPSDPDSLMANRSPPSSHRD